MRRFLNSAGLLFSVLGLVAYSWPGFVLAGQMKQQAPHYKLLPAQSQGNLTVFPVISDTSFDTTNFLTLDDGMRSGQVVVTETGHTTALLRPRPSDSGVWRERPRPLPHLGAQVNELALINTSDRPLILLAGEIVTGGKQDRVVGKDRIIPAHSEPVDLSVFCVEPHRWTETSVQFGTLHFSMAQPSVRAKAMADQNQQEVWNEVARSRSAFVAAAPLVEGQVRSTSSYAGAMQTPGVKHQIDSIAVPLEHSYQDLLRHLHDQHALGVVVAVDNELIWADVFASSSLFEKYWPKLVRSYAAEAIAPHYEVPMMRLPPTQASAQAFLDNLSAKRETIESEPGVYRTTELIGSDFDAFVLTSLLPNTDFNVHLAKMKR
ncbi:MAG TPA: DUF6569 family protein [Bryobacteraceae bacterium]|nr:DUF6569 family protein [Bryobacteraceae bacterium]